MPRATRPVEPGVQVLELGTADVADQRVAPRGPVAGRTSEVDHGHGEPGVDVGLHLGAPRSSSSQVGPPCGRTNDRERSVAVGRRRRSRGPTVRAGCRTGTRRTVVRPAARSPSAREHLVAAVVEDARRVRAVALRGGTTRCRRAGRGRRRSGLPDARSASSVLAARSSGRGDAGPRPGARAATPSRRATSRARPPRRAGPSGDRSSHRSPAPRSPVAGSPVRSWITASRRRRRRATMRPSTGSSPRRGGRRRPRRSAGR